MRTKKVYKSIVNREEYEINDIVKCVREYHGISGVIVDKKRIQQPFATHILILYCIKNSSDNHYHWVNSLYVEKVIQ